MTTLNSALDFGFSNDEINAEALREQNTALNFGFSNKEIEEAEGIKNSNWIRTITNVNKPTLSTITDRLDSGFSPYIEIGGRKGRFNFDVPKREDDKTPGFQYQFEAEDGNNYWFQLEKDYQGGRWDAADHAETNYNEYKTWGAETRKELLNQMWAGSPQIAEFINTSVTNDTPWEEVKAGLQQFNTYRQISNFDVTGKPEIDENLIAMIENYELMGLTKGKGFAMMPEFVIPEDASEETRAFMEKILKVRALAKEDPNGLLTKEWEWEDVPGYGYDSAVVGLAHEFLKLRNGDEDAIQSAAEMILTLQAYDSQSWGKKTLFRISGIGSELPIMIPAGAAGAWACGSVSAPAGPVVSGFSGAGCGMGFAFAAPAFFRDLLTNLMDEEMGIVDAHGVFDLLASAAEEGSWEFLIGALTGIAGKGTKVGMESLGVTNKFLTGGATLTTETATMVSASGLVHDYTPTLQDFTNTAIDLLILRGGNKGFKETKDLMKRKYQGTEYYVRKNLMKLYAQSGIDPRAVKQHIKDNPTLARELIETLGKKKFVMPDYYMRHVAEVMNRLEQVSRSTIKVGEQDFVVSRYYDAKNGEMEIMSRFDGEFKGMPDKITFKLTEDGNWTIKEMEGDLSIKGIQAIADFAESKGRQIVRTEGFDKAYEIMEMRQEKVETLDPRDQTAVDLMEGVQKTADELRALGKDKEANEVMTEGRNLLEQAVGKDYLSQAEAKVKEHQQFTAEKTKTDAANAEYRATGFHPPEMIFKDTFGKIDELKIPKHDVETELVVTHSTESFNAAKIAEFGMDVASGKGFLHFGTDGQARGRASGMTDPAFLRVQVKYNKPLDARQWKNFDEATSGLENPLMTAQYFLFLGKGDVNHPARFTQDEFNSVRAAEGIEAQSLRVAEIFKSKGYDAIIYKNQVEAPGDSVAILNNANIRVLGYAKPTSKVVPPKPEVKKSAEEIKLDNIIKEGQELTQQDHMWAKNPYAEEGGLKAKTPRITLQQADRYVYIDRYGEGDTAFVDAFIVNRQGNKFTKLRISEYDKKDGTVGVDWQTIEHDGARYKPNTTVQKIAGRLLAETREVKEQEALDIHEKLKVILKYKADSAELIIKDNFENTLLRRDVLKNEVGVYEIRDLPEHLVQEIKDVTKSKDDFLTKAVIEAEGNTQMYFDKGMDKAERDAPYEPFSFVGEPAARVTPKGQASDGGYNLSLTENSTQANKIMTMPALVEVVEMLMDGKLPGIYKNLGEGTQGLFSHIPGEGKDSGQIKLRADIFKDPKMAAKTVAHEIGHMVDWLEGTENYTMSRGNILGRLGAMKKYLQTYMEGRPGGKKPLTQKEKNKLRYAAEKFIKNEVQEIAKVPEIKELGITPQQIKDIFTGVMKRADVDPQVYTFIQKAGRKLKKDITRTAMKGKIHPEILRIIKSGKENKAPTEDIKKRVLEKYHEMFDKEVTERELLSRDVVMDELKKVTQAWRPFDEAANPKYTKYRHNTKELYADFFSAIMTNPQFAKLTAPTAYEGFFNWLSKKPEFKKTYDRIQEELTNGKTLDVAEQRIREGFRKGEEKFFDKVDKDEHVFKGKGREFAKILFDQYWYIISDVKNYKSSNVPDHKNPIFKIDEMRYQASEAEGYMNDMNARVVDRMDQARISHEDMGMYLFLRRVVNERSELANPRGFDKDSAALRMSEMEKRNPLLAELANEYWQVRKEWVIDRLEQANTYPKHLMDKLKNNDAYAKFDVVEYFDEHFGPGSGGHIFGQIGTLKDIANPFTRTMVNDMLLMRGASQNIALNTTVDFYRQAHTTDPKVFAFEPAKKRFTGRYHEFVESTNPDLKLIRVMKNGKMEGYYLDKYVAEAFERNPLDGNAVIGGMRTFNNTIRTILTDINPGFWMVNMIRDYNRTIKNLPATGTGKYIPYKQYFEYFKYWRQGFKPALRSVYGIPDPVIKEMYKNNELISIEERGNDFKADTEMERLLKRHHQKPHVWEKEITMPLKWLYRHMTNMGQAIERQNKVAAHQYIKDKFPDMTAEMQGHMIRVQAGSPAFLRKGTGNPVVNNIFMFSNAMKEGWRGDLEVMKDRPAEYMYKTVQNNVVPKLIMYGMAVGMFGEESKTIMDGVSEYDKMNYIIIPIGLGKNGESIYFRIPQDETGRVFGGITWKSLNQGKDEDVRTVVDYTAGQLPTLSPPLTAIGSLIDYFSDQMPYDHFRQRPALNQTTWDAGYPERDKAMAGYMWNTLGGGIYKRYDTQNLEKIKSDIEELIHFPILENTLGRFLKVSDYGVRQELQKATEPVVQQSAKESLAANNAINQLILDPNYQMSDEEISALASKSKTLDKRTQRIFANVYGNVFVQELMKAPTIQARQAMFEKIRELAKEGNILAQEYLGETSE